MKRIFWLAAGLVSLHSALLGQAFEMSALQESYRGNVGETIKAPLRFKNNTDKPITLVVRRINTQIGSTQKNYYCFDNNCLDQKLDDVLIRIEAGQTLSSLQITLEGGLAGGESVVKFIAYSKQNPSDYTEFDVNFVVEEKVLKPSIYTSKAITLHDVYPNPVTDYAYVDYKILNDRSKARIVIHNILGNPLSTYDLPASENKVKIKTDDLNSGIYFYSLYIDGEAVLTRKLVVKN